MRLTIRIAGTSTTPIATAARGYPPSVYGQAYTVAAVTLAAAGLGMPTK